MIYVLLLVVAAVALIGWMVAKLAIIIEIERTDREIFGVGNVPAGAGWQFVLGEILVDWLDRRGSRE